jgi:hypothetical protein
MIKVLAGLLTIAMLTGCSSSFGIRTSSTTTAPHKTTEWYGTKVLLENDCPLTPRDQSTVSTEALPAIIIPVIAAVAPTLIDKGLGLLSNYLKKQKDKYTATLEAKAAGQFYSGGDEAVNPRYGCLVIVRGAFGEIPSNTGESSPANVWWTSQNLQKVGLVQPPAFYLELVMNYIGGSPPTHIVLWPVRLDYSESAAKRVRGYPETLSPCRSEIKQPPCGNETQGDRRERAYSA